jgi:hypothetical protein
MWTAKKGLYGFETETCGRKDRISTYGTLHFSHWVQDNKSIPQLTGFGNGGFSFYSLEICVISVTRGHTPKLCLETVSRNRIDRDVVNNSEITALASSLRSILLQHGDTANVTTTESNGSYTRECKLELRNPMTRMMKADLFIFNAWRQRWWWWWC